MEKGDVYMFSFTFHKKMKIYIKRILTILGIFVSTGLTAQYYESLNESYSFKLKHFIDSSNNHSSIKPYIIPPTKSFYESYSNPKMLSSNKKLHQRIFHENIIQINDNDYQILVDPLFHFEWGRDFSADLNTYVNTRGVQIKGRIGKNFTFYTSFYENQARFPEYVTNEINNTRVVPGQGKARNFGNGGFDYARSSAYISYTPSKYFNFQFGTSKHFFGDGYRSLLLSDNSFNYPFLKITTSFWKLKYVNLFTQFQDLKSPYSSNLGYQKKYAAMHYLSWNVSKKLTIGLFEAIIFQDQDSTGKRGFEINYLNPIIFYRPVEFSVGSPDNAILGLNLKYKISASSFFYGQFILDEFKINEVFGGNGWWANKFGYQLGLKFYNFLKVKNLYTQFEYNRVRPYTYAHWTSLQNYGHYNQPLAHPRGANFWEFITLLRYNRDRLFFNYQFIYSKYGQNPLNENFGGNIFLSYRTRARDYGNEIGQGISTTLVYNNLEISYLINPSFNFNAYIGFTSRIETTPTNRNTTNFFYLGLRTSINNYYYDY